MLGPIPPHGAIASPVQNTPTGVHRRRIPSWTGRAGPGRHASLTRPAQPADTFGYDTTARIDDAAEKFVRDFVKAWTKVTELDRFDLR